MVGIAVVEVATQNSLTTFLCHMLTLHTVEIEVGDKGKASRVTIRVASAGWQLAKTITYMANPGQNADSYGRFGGDGFSGGKLSNSHIIVVLFCAFFGS